MSPAPTVGTSIFPYPPVSFDFYLDPNAGRSTIISEDGEIRFEDIVDEGTRFHYTWQLTETYRERLGYWNYVAPYGTHFLIPRGQDVIDTRQSGDTTERPAILVPEVGLIRLPGFAGTGRQGRRDRAGS